MNSKSLIFLTFFGFVAFVGLPVIAQTPEPQRERGAQGMVWSFDEGSFLGVQTAEVNRANFGKFGLRDVRGVAVEKVLEGSPAQAAGLQEGDVIVRFNGQEVGSSRMLTRLVNEVSPDHSARVTVVRGGAERELNVTIGKRPMPRFEEGAFNFKFPDGFPHIDIPNVQIPNVPPMPKIDVRPPEIDIPDLPEFDHDFVFSFPRRQIGVSLIGMTKQMSDNFGVAGGAMISEVRENSPAAKAGLKAGDIIVEIDGKAVRGDGEVMRAMGEKKDGDVTLTIVRDRNRQTLKVTPEESKGGFQFFGVPGAPKTPGTMILVRPDKMTPPMPLNNLFIPGRVI
jgi:membrane-associated protease RseP (regulator of RpoE activity)